MMRACGASVLFVPSNNGLPPDEAGPDLVVEARNCDIARAAENGVWIIQPTSRGGLPAASPMALRESSTRTESCVSRLWR
jgi:hypothetical protein